MPSRRSQPKADLDAEVRSVQLIDGGGDVRVCLARCSV